MSEPVRLELLDFDSPDVEFLERDLSTIEGAAFLLQFEIKQVDVVGADLFQVMVATPEGLRDRAKGAVISKRAMLVFAELRWPEIESTVLEIVESCRRQTWVESVLCLQRYFQWEYEDYVTEEATKGRD